MDIIEIHRILKVSLKGKIMQNYTRIIGVTVIVILLLVIPAVQLYNYQAFSYEFKEDTLNVILKQFTKINDEQAGLARSKISQEITNAGYSIDAKEIEFKAVLPGAPRTMSKEIYQITDPGIGVAELQVEVPLTIKVLFFNSNRTITATKNLRL
jgi:hypothetical protein